MSCNIRSSVLRLPDIPIDPDDLRLLSGIRSLIPVGIINCFILILLAFLITKKLSSKGRKYRGSTFFCHSLTETAFVSIFILRMITDAYPVESYFDSPSQLQGVFTALLHSLPPAENSLSYLKLLLFLFFVL